MGILQPEGGAGADVGACQWGGSTWDIARRGGDEGAGPSNMGAAADPVSLANDLAIMDG